MPEAPVRAAVIGVQLYATQLELLERARADGTSGATRAEVLLHALKEHVDQHLQGEGTTFVSGLAFDDSLGASPPAYGPSRLSVTLEPITGKAIPVARGEVLRIEQVQGGQCVDFNAFNLHDYKEILDCGFTRSFQSFNPGRGDLIWTNAPRGRPMFAILGIAESCALDITGHRCNRISQELAWGLTDHSNCQDTLAEAIREFGLAPDDVHDSFNLWMNTAIDDTGRRRFQWNEGRPGDRVDLLALFDVLAVPALCGIGDMAGVNNFRFAPIDVEVLAASDDTRALTNRVEAKWGRLASQVRPETAQASQIRDERALSAEDGYEPRFLPPPATVVIDTELTDTELHMLDGLIETGLYGDTREEALRASFMRWCNENVALIPRARIVFDSETDG